MTKDLLKRRIRVTVARNSADPTDDLRYAARVRTDLWANSPVEIDPNSPENRTHRDPQQQTAYFEVVTEFPNEVKRVINDFGHSQRVQIEEFEATDREACQHCDYVADGILPAVCPKCGQRDIASCPNCNEDVPRQEYINIFGDAFRCPRCNHRVRLAINPDLVRSDGTFNEPVVVTESAQD